MLLPSDRIGTALHEAAHAVVLAAFGAKIYTASIVPTEESKYAPGSLGHVCYRPFFPPQADDAWLGSEWAEARQMFCLAGYLVESLADNNPRHARLATDPGSDHNKAISLMHVLSARQPGRALEHIERVERRVIELFSLPRYLTALELVARGLLDRETLSGKDVHDLAFDGRCGAVHRTRPDMRCSNRYGFDHWRHRNRDETGTVTTFETLRRPGGRRTKQMGLVKHLQMLNAGGPGPNIPATWDVVIGRLENIPRATFREYTQSPLGQSLETIAYSLATGSPVPNEQWG